jgi:hypothetical protein
MNLLYEAGERPHEIAVRAEIGLELFGPALDVDRPETHRRFLQSMSLLQGAPKWLGV